MTDGIFLYDSYAIIEIIEGNEKYNDYLDKKIVINDFIFAELCYVLIRNNYPNFELYLEKYKKFIVHVNPSVIQKAMRFRFQSKKKDMSMTDCISYIQSKELGIKFLTGDKEFENLDNVEFMKK